MDHDVDSDEQPSAALPRNRGGKACTNCTRIKCKCIPRLEGTSCARCHRLNKTCEPSVSTRRRGPKRDVATRSTKLEEKLDDLVSLLRARHVPLGSSQGGTAAGDSENDGLEIENDTHPSSTAVASVTTPGEVYTNAPSPAEADEALRKFCDDMISFCPYIHVPPYMTSSQLRDTYPFLWLNIMSVAIPSVKMRTSLNDQAREIIVQRIVAGGERSLDLLLGILTYVNWAPMFRMDKHFASLASQLAVALVWDLGLQMPPPENPMRFPPGFQVGCLPQQPSRKERTNEERRAVLGAFVITSVASHCFKAADGLRWSPYLDEYLAHLARQSTLSQDKVLIAEVKMQLITNQIRHSPWKARNVDIPPLYVNALRSQLDGIAGVASGTSVLFENNLTILGFYHFTMLMIHEPALPRSPTPWNEPDPKRFDIFQRCLDSIKAWLDGFFSVPLAMYVNMPCTFFSQLFYVLVCLHKITTARDPAWNPTAAREVVDLLPTMDRIVFLFEQIKAAALLRSPDHEEDPALAYGVRKFTALKMAWQMEMASKDRDDDGNQEIGVANDSQMFFPTSPMDYFGFDMLPDMLDGVSWQ